MLSFREKSLWVSILISLIIASIYGDNVFAVLFGGVALDAKDVSALISQVVIAFIVLEIILHIALSMGDQEGADAKEDERERNYRLVANNSGYWVLSIGLIMCAMQQMAVSHFEFAQNQGYENFIVAPIELKLVTVFWLSEVVRFAHEVYLYRKED